MKYALYRLLPLLVIVVLMVIVYFTNVQEYFNLEQIRKEETFLKVFVGNHPILSPLIFIGVYIVSVVLIIPDSTILTILSGFVFFPPLAFLYSLLSETLGAIIFYGIIRTVLGDKWLTKQEATLKKMRKEFNSYPASYLLFLRFSHIFPFWLTNAFAVYFKVPFRTFVWTAALGTIPLTYLLVQAGSGLSRYFESDASVSLWNVFSIQMKIALLLVGILALTPIIYYKFIRKK